MIETKGPATGHVGLNVSDLERSKRFYVDLLGLEVKGEGAEGARRFAFLGDADRLVLTLWQQSDGRFDRGRPGLHHLSFQVSTMEQVRAAERKLRALGAPLLYDGVVPHAEGTSSGGIYFEDPDGIRLEIYSTSGAEGRHAPHGAAPSCGFF
jgi:lactoylglutathione lyase